MEFTSFPAAIYRKGESRLVDSQEDADAAEKDGWSDKFDQAAQLPAEPPVAAQLPAGDRPRAEQPIAEPPAKPKKKGE